MIQRTEFGSITDLPAWGTESGMGFAAAMVAINIMKTFQFEIAGTKFRMAEYRAASPTRGDRLTLVLEPTNKFDPLAIKVMKGEHHIGYVPRTHNKDRTLQEALRDRPQEVGCCVDAAWASGCWVVVNIKEKEDEKEPEQV